MYSVQHIPYALQRPIRLDERVLHVRFVPWWIPRQMLGNHSVWPTPAHKVHMPPTSGLTPAGIGIDGRSRASCPPKETVIRGLGWVNWSRGLVSIIPESNFTVSELGGVWVRVGNAQTRPPPYTDNQQRVEDNRSGYSLPWSGPLETLAPQDTPSPNASPSTPHPSTPPPNSSSRNSRPCSYALHPMPSSQILAGQRRRA